MSAFYIKCNIYYTSCSEIKAYTPRYINSYAFYGAGITQIILPHGINNYWYNGMVEGSQLYARLTSDKNLDAEDYGKKSDREWISAYAQACEYYPYTGKDGIKYAFGWCTGSLENSKFSLYAYNGSSLTNDNMSLIYSDKHGYETGGKDLNNRKTSFEQNNTNFPYVS